VFPIFTAAVLLLFLQGAALAAPTSQYPVLLNSFPGVSDPGNVAPPNASGAAGLAHLVAMTSAGMAVFDKGTGNLLSQVPLQEFWAPLGTGAGEPAAQPAFGPRVIYNKHLDRFVAVSLAGRQAPDSWLLVAASATPDPTGPWFQWAINVSQNIVSYTSPFFPPEIPPPPTLWADYPCVEFSDDLLYITVNMLTNDNVYQYPKEYYVPTAQLLSGTTPLAWAEHWDPIHNEPQWSPNAYSFFPYVSRFAWQPVQSYGSFNGAYFLGEVVPDAIRILTAGTAAFPYDGEVGYLYVGTYPDAALPPAQQAGDAPPIETNDQRLQSAVYRDGFLWIVRTLADDTNSRTEIAWYQIDLRDAVPPDVLSTWDGVRYPGHTPVQQGRISDPVRSYFNPSIAVNENHDVVIGFSGSSPQEYPSAFYASRAGSDPPGTMRPVEPLKAGTAPYTRFVDGTHNAWGLYSTTIVDPIDDLTFWTLQEYAAADNTWGTWWGVIAASPPRPSAVVVTATPPGPVEPGPQVVFEAVATGGSGSYEYQFWGKKSTQAAYSLARDYSPDNTWVWNTAGAGAGTYYVQAYARNAGSTLASEAISAPLPYVISIPGGGVPVDNVRLSALSFTGQATGGSGNYEYEFRGRLQGATEWGLAQAYGPSPTWLWPTFDVPSGTYEIKMNTRNAGSADLYQAAETVSCTVNSPPPATGPVSGLPSETPSAVSDPTPATGVHLSSLVFHAQAGGGSGNYEYEYLWRTQGGNWGPARAYDADPSWIWSTYEVPPGTYEFRINARNVGSEAPFEATDNVSCTLAMPRAASVTITANPQSPESVGMKVNFTAAASPANGNYEYEFRGRLAGGAWGVARSYDQGPSWEWDTAGAAPGTYEVLVNARHAGSTAAYEATQTVSFVVTPPGLVVTITPDLPSPQAPNTNIRFLAGVTGATGQYEYEFQGRPVGGTWTVVKGYGWLTEGPPLGASWTWTSPPPGSYEIMVNARSAGSNSPAEATTTISYVIQ
jgi:hypothetical protein